nr:immunoglobulin heavy chain junction region [Macaca mulatta]
CARAGMHSSGWSLPIDYW